MDETWDAAIARFRELGGARPAQRAYIRLLVVSGSRSPRPMHAPQSVALRQAYR